MPAFYDSGYTYDSGATFSEFLRTSFAFDTNGVAKARGKLKGTINLKFSTQALLLGELEASGLTSVTFSSSSKLLGRFPAKGSTTFTFVPDGYISKLGRVKTSITFRFTSNNNLLAGRANALGNPILSTVVPPVQMYAVGKLESIDTVAFNPFGPGKARGKLVAESTFSFSSSNTTLRGRGRVTGVPSKIGFTTLSRLEIKVPLFASITTRFSITSARLRISPFEGSKTTGFLSPHTFSEGKQGLLFEDTSGVTPTPYSSSTEE